VQNRPASNHDLVERLAKEPKMKREGMLPEEAAEMCGKLKQ
jgi:hypothetical protein